MPNGRLAFQRLRFSAPQNKSILPQFFCLLCDATKVNPANDTSRCGSLKKKKKNLQYQRQRPPPHTLMSISRRTLWLQLDDSIFTQYQRVKNRYSSNEIINTIEKQKKKKIVTHRNPSSNMTEDATPKHREREKKMCL